MPDPLTEFLANWPRPHVLLLLSYPETVRAARAAGLTYADIDHHCRVGAVYAARNYDPAFKFTTYAPHWMRSTVQREVARLAPGGVQLCERFSPVRYDPPPDLGELAALAARLLTGGDLLVIRRLFGLDGDPVTMGDLAAELGVTRTRVSQRRDRALRKLREHMEGVA